MKNKSYPKMVVIFALVLAMATPLWFALPATLCYAQSGYGGGGGDIGLLHPGLTSLIGKIDFYTRKMLTTVTSQSPDKRCELTINKGTKATNIYGGALAGLTNVTMKEPPAPPPNTNFICLVYEFGPPGATFDPSATLTVTYDPDDIPEGVNEKDLVLAYWDGDEWVVLEGSVVDPEANTITAPVSHFSAFTVMAYSAPAAFTISDLTITPAEVNVGETVTISATVTNTGDLTGDYEAILNIDGVVIATKKITLDGPASQELTFTTSKDAGGTYTVGLGGLSGTFTVKAPPAPTPAPPAPAPAPPAPTQPAPTPPPPAPTPPAPAPVPTAPPAAPPWPIIGGIIAGLIVFGVIFWLITMRVEI